jgi:O-antigen ligase
LIADFPLEYGLIVRYGLGKRNGNRSSWLENWARITALRVFVAVVSLSAVPFGSARPWSAALLTLLLGGCALGWAAVVMRGHGGPGLPPRRIAVPALLFGAALLWAVLQSLPVLPVSWAHPVWAEAEVALGPLPRTVSLHPRASLEAVTRLVGYGCAFFLALQMAASRSMAARLLDGLAGFAMVLAVYGLAEYASGTETIGWIDKWAYRGDLTATLVNRNHYATLAGLGLLCVLAALFRRLDGLNGRQVTRLFLAGRHRGLWLLAAGLPVLGAALILTHSRGGVGACLLGLAVLLIALRLGTGLWQRAATGLGLALLFALAALALLPRLEGMAEDGDSRYRVYAMAVELVQLRPWLGTGLGTFADAFAAVRPVTIVQLWDQAHNTWLEMMVELGVPAASCIFAALITLAWRCLRGVFVRRRDSVYPALGLAACVLVGSHALLDFSMQIPAVAVLFSTILGLAVAQSWSSRPTARRDQR